MEASSMDGLNCVMSKIGRPIVSNKKRTRIHYVPEWAQTRGIRRQTELAKEIDTTDPTVSRWWAGITPEYSHLIKLADFFGTTVDGLFRHPADDALIRAVGNMSNEEKLELASVLAAYKDMPSNTAIRVLNSFRAAVS